MKFLLIFLLPVVLLAQDSTSLRYFPYQTGNMWELFYYDGPMYVDTTQIFNTLDSIDQSGNIYLTQVRRSINPIESAQLFFLDTVNLRIDTLNQVWGPSEHPLDSVLLYKLDAEHGDIWAVELETNDDGDTVRLELARVTTYQIFLWGEYRTVKYFTYYAPGHATDTTGLDRYADGLLEGIGFYYRGGGDMPGLVTLIGAVVDSVLYGDTTKITTSIKDHSLGLVHTIELMQNYPNPFNNRTKIKFIINKPSNISLIIYDITGREVKRIVNNEFYRPGEHTVNWDGMGNNNKVASSGTYFYAIFLKGKLFKAKPMVLLK